MENEVQPLLFVIIGTTGSGKTKLSVELAESVSRKWPLKSQIVSADSMQIYRRLDVLSAKATAEEQSRVKHHLIDIVDLDDSTFAVPTYQQLATRTISDLFRDNAVPILVGGTNFYIESVLWENKYTFEPPTKPLDPVIQQELESLTNEALHTRLRAVDPSRAELLHQNARRKVMRSLEIFHTSGKPHSQIIQEQHAEPKLLRYKTCVFWVHCEKHVLDTRLDDRVDDMVRSGLKEELKMVAQAFKETKQIDWTKGCLQSIGLHEFRAWIAEYLQTGNDNAHLFETALAEVKTHSRQYARGQISWIRNSLEPSMTIYQLDSTDPKLWRDKVLNPALDIASALMKGEDEAAVEKLISQRWTDTVRLFTPSPIEEPEAPTVWKKYHCDICDKTVNGEQEWIAHGKSKAHHARRRRALKPAPTYPPKNKPTTATPEASSSTDPT